MSPTTFTGPVSSIATATTAMTNLVTTMSTTWAAMPARPEGSCDWHILLVMALDDEHLDADPGEYTLLWHPATCHVNLSSQHGLKYDCMMENELDRNGYEEFELEAGLYFVRCWAEKHMTLDGAEWDAGIEQVDVVEFMQQNPPPI